MYHYFGYIYFSVAAWAQTHTGQTHGEIAREVKKAKIQVNVGNCSPEKSKKIED